MIKGEGWYWSPGNDIQYFSAGDGVISTPGFVQSYGGYGSVFVEDFICFDGPVADFMFDSGVISNGIVPNAIFSGFLDFPTELGWWFTTKGPNDVQPVWLSDATDQNQLPTIDSTFSGNAECQVVDVIAAETLAINYNFDTSGSRNVILRQGESFSLSGIVASPFVLSGDCGKAPRYIPTTIVSASDCIGSVNETFGFSDFIRGTSGQQTTISTNTLGCDIDVIYQISVQ